MIERGAIDSTELLSRLRDLAAQAQGGAAGQPREAGAAEFSDMLKSALDNVNNAQQQASGLAKALELGDPSVTVADVMIAAQKSSLSFQAMAQVRNRLVAAYQEIMSMQV
jgi:flagellar hook-basal body complex protein FliE